MVAYSFKPMFVGPIKAGRKCQTIRKEGLRRHARPGETLQLYTGMRTKNCKLIGLARCVSVEPIRIDVPERDSNEMVIWLRGKPLGSVTKFSRADGFPGAREMCQFWLKEHGPGTFDGVLIQWEQFGAA